VYRRGSRSLGWPGAGGSRTLGQRPVEEAVKDMAKKISDLLQAEGNA
jgi:hypothetical protein